MMKPLKCDDGLYCATVLQESLNWHRCCLETISFAVFQAALWSCFSSGSKNIIKKKKCSIYHAVFFTLAEFLIFCNDVFQTPGFKIKEQVGQTCSTIFICPYGYIKSSFTALSHTHDASIIAAKGWEPLFLDLTVDTGRLNCSYRGLNVILCFILKELHVQRDGKKHIYYEVVIPKETDSLVTIMPGVRFFGRRGIVAADIVVQRTCRLPVLKYRADKTKLNKLMLCFRPFQVINNMLQWKTRPISKPVALGAEAPAGNQARFALAIPSGFGRFTGDLSAEFVDEGNLVGLEGMFKLYENEWRHFKVTRFIGAVERGLDRPFQYVLRFLNGGSQKGASMPVLFDLQKYNGFAEDNATLGTWFLIEEN